MMAAGSVSACSCRSKWRVVGSGVVVAAVGDAGLAEGGEGDGVAAGFGEEVAAEAEHVRPAAQGAVGGFAAHPALGVADVPAGVDEPFGVGSGRVRVQAEGVGGDAGGGVAGGLGAFGGVLGEVAGDGQAGHGGGAPVGDGADVEFVAPGDEPAFAVRAVGVGPGAEGDGGGGLADGVLEVGGGDAGRRGDDRVGVFAVGAVEAEQGVEVDGAACLVLGGLAVGQAQGLLVFRERGKVDLAGCVTVPGEAGSGGVRCPVWCAATVPRRRRSTRRGRGSRSSPGTAARRGRDRRESAAGSRPGGGRGGRFRRRGGGGRVRACSGSGVCPRRRGGGRGGSGPGRTTGR